MGCDGGTIPRRNELVKVKQKPEPRDQTSHLIFQWRYCNLTQQLLQRPIVTCGLGKLYNKSDIIQARINRESPPHIRTSRAVITLNLTPNPEFRENGTDQIDVSPYICPVTGLEMSGKYRFVALWSCGCVFSERALKEIGVGACSRCQEAFDEADVVVLNGLEGEVRLKMDMRKKWKKEWRKIQRIKKVRVGENLQ